MRKIINQIILFIFAILIIALTYVVIISTQNVIK